MQPFHPKPINPLEGVADTEPIKALDVRLEGVLWKEEIPNAFLQMLTTWASDIRQSIVDLVHGKGINDKNVIKQCLDTVRGWSPELRQRTSLPLQMRNPRIVILFEYCFLRYLREVNTVGTIINLKPPPFDEFAHVFLINTLDLPNESPVLAMRATMLHFIDFAAKTQKTNVTLLDSLAEELV